MLKKIAALGGAAALIGTMALPAFASTVNPCCRLPKDPCCPQVKITNDNLSVKSADLLSTVSTGNLVLGKGAEVENASVKSGSALLSLTAQTQVNSNGTTVTSSRVKPIVVDNNNTSFESGNVLSTVGTGNLIGGEVEKASVKSGGATALFDLITIVNSNVTAVGK